jgi:hypothetical protein
MLLFSRSLLEGRITMKERLAMPKAARSNRKNKPLIKEDDLREVIEQIIAEDPANADLLVLVFCKMIAGINEGAEGVERTRSALKLCLDSISPHLGTGRLSASHLLQHLEDLLNQAGLPDVGMDYAIELMAERDE